MISDQEIINIVTARTQGKKILRIGKFVLGNPAWAVMRESDEWDFAGYNYMVAPEPRMLYAEIVSGGMLIQSSLRRFTPTNGGKIVEFKEVSHE